ncbi:hypothetical protein OPV22_009774 [Ensete ventricosum]|uniref:Uncharacterized protein n=1 Tax=Ensete ventricosum TaxID=4639 RepID=A0AAV8RE34_ENSVE|nr:hypothetical protein OPV22_009774 [Ensete ventricosum]
MRTSAGDPPSGERRQLVYLRLYIPPTALVLRIFLPPSPAPLLRRICNHALDSVLRSIWCGRTVLFVGGELTRGLHRLEKR